MKTHEHRIVAGVALALALALAACGGPDAVTTPEAPVPALAGTDGAATLSDQERAGNGPTPGAPNVPVVGAVTLEVLTQALTDAIASEYFARTTYERVLADFGPVAPFEHVVLAEATHVDALAALFVKRGLSVPANPYAVDEQPPFVDLVDACKSAAAIEEGVYGTYAGLATIKGLPDDVARVFTQMMEVTLDHHLPAFQQCAAW